MMRNAALSFLAALCVVSRTATAFYLPGVHPETFDKGDEVPLKVNALTSTKTQIPRDYYRLPFCQPEGGPTMASENLGEFLTGNKIQSSPYQINMLTEVSCQKVGRIWLLLLTIVRKGRKRIYFSKIPTVKSL